jgi:hypothetical protein
MKCHVNPRRVTPTKSWSGAWTPNNIATPGLRCGLAPDAAAGQVWRLKPNVDQAWLRVTRQRQ